MSRFARRMQWGNAMIELPGAFTDGLAWEMDYAALAQKSPSTLFRSLSALVEQRITFNPAIPELLQQS